MKKRVAKALLDTEALFFRPDEPFIWASGIESPVYCDNRLVLTDVQSRRIIEESLIEWIKTEYPQAQAVFGTATAGIPHAAIAGYELDIPMGYVRSGAKDHGRANQIEGRVQPGQKVLVIEDLISTGMSSLAAVRALREAGAEVLGMVAIFTYGFDLAREQFAAAGVPLTTLSNYGLLTEEALASGYIDAKGFEALKAWREAPSEWGR